MGLEIETDYKSKTVLAPLKTPKRASKGREQLAETFHTWPRGHFEQAHGVHEARTDEDLDYTRGAP